MRNNETPQTPEPADNRTLLERHANDLITLDGVTFPLSVWFAYCPIPHDEMDPAKLEAATQAFLDGKNPFATPEPSDS